MSLPTRLGPTHNLGDRIPIFPHFMNHSGVYVEQLEGDISVHGQRQKHRQQGISTLKTWMTSDSRHLKDRAGVLWISGEVKLRHRHLNLKFRHQILGFRHLSAFLDLGHDAYLCETGLVFLWVTHHTHIFSVP